MSSKRSKRVQEFRAARTAARTVDYQKRKNQRRKDRKHAERLAADPSYRPGAVEARTRMFARHKQLRRWYDALIRRDPRSAQGRRVREMFIKLTKLNTDEEILQELDRDGVSPLVKVLFTRVFGERAKALELKGEKNLDAVVEDWWGEGRNMESPGHSMAGDESGGGKGSLLEEEGYGDDGEDEGQRMAVDNGEAIGGLGEPAFEDEVAGWRTHGLNLEAWNSRDTW